MGKLIDMSKKNMDEKWTELVMEELAEFINERKLGTNDIRILLDVLDDYVKCPACSGMNVSTLVHGIDDKLVCNECGKVFWEDD